MLLTIPFFYIIILIFLVVIVFVLGFIFGILNSQRTRKQRDETNDVAETMIESDSVIHSLPSNNQKTENKKNDTLRNRSYTRYPGDNYYRKF